MWPWVPGLWQGAAVVGPSWRKKQIGENIISAGRLSLLKYRGEM